MQTANAALLVLEWQYGLLHSPWALLPSPGICQEKCQAGATRVSTARVCCESPWGNACGGVFPPDLPFLGCAVSAPFGWDLQELSLNSSWNSGLCCYVWHPKSFIFNPDCCISAFERFYSFPQTRTKILLKVPLIVKAIGASSLLPGVQPRNILDGSRSLPNY